MIKVVWWNVGIAVRREDANAFSHAHMREDRAKLQASLDKIRQSNKDFPDKANKAISDYVKNSPLVNKDEIYPQEWNGPFEKAGK
jgi:hypothetical protein